MIEILIIISKALGAVGTILIAAFALIVWLRPVRIVVEARLSFDERAPDEILATVVNKSNRPIYIVDCVARGTYTWRYIFGRCFRRPWMHPRFYSGIRFAPNAHELSPTGEVKVEPQQPLKFRHRLCDHPLSKFYTSFFLIEVTLSSGRKFRSKKRRVPVRWRARNAV